VTVEVLVQELSQVQSVFADIFHQVLFLHDILDFQGAGAAHGMALVGVSVGEGTGQVRFRLSSRIKTAWNLTRFHSSAHLQPGG
jgi:hypothetical protein